MNRLIHKTWKKEKERERKRDNISERDNKEREMLEREMLESLYIYIHMRVCVCDRYIN